MAAKVPQIGLIHNGKVECPLFAPLAWHPAGRQAYCERCGHWLGATTAVLPGGCVKQLTSALECGSLEKLPTLEPIFGERPQRFCELAIAGCSHGQPIDEATIYVSVTEIVRDNQRLLSRRHVDQLQITPDDLAILYDRCPGLQIEPCEMEPEEVV